MCRGGGADRLRPLTARVARPATIPRLSLHSVGVVICSRRRWCRRLVVRTTHDVALCSSCCNHRRTQSARRQNRSPKGVASDATTPRIRRRQVLAGGASLTTTDHNVRGDSCQVESNGTRTMCRVPSTSWSTHARTSAPILSRPRVAPGATKPILRLRLRGSIR